MPFRWLAKKLSKLDLWPRMALAITLGFLTLFAAFSVISERALQDSIDKLLEERLAITQLIADQIDYLLADAIFELERATPLFVDENGDIGAAELATLAQTYGQIGLFPDGIVLLDHQGRVLGSQPPELYASNTSLARQIHIQNTLRTGDPTIAEPFPHPIDGYPVTAVTVPLTHENQLVGLLIGFMSLDGRGVIMPLNRAAIIGQTEHAVLVDKQGRALASTFGLPFLSPGEHISFYQEAMAAGKPAVETVPFELSLPGEETGHLHVMAFVPLQNVPWGLAVGGDRAGDAFASVQQLRIGLVIIGIIALSAVWIITLLGTRRLVEPVQQLTVSAHQIAAGNLDISLETNDGGEIGIMASALNDMRNQLLFNIDELSQWNEKLESRVEEQTEHLRDQQQLTQQLLQQVITAQGGRTSSYRV
jgi:HAMP domain-containing protein